jgi:hypothetical protein
LNTVSDGLAVGVLSTAMYSLSLKIDSSTVPVV